MRAKARSALIRGDGIKWRGRVEKKRKEKPDANLPGSPPSTSSGWQRVWRPNSCFSASSFLESCQDILGPQPSTLTWSQTGATLEWPEWSPSQGPSSHNDTMLHVFFIPLTRFKRRFIKCFPPPQALRFPHPLAGVTITPAFPGPCAGPGMN